MSLRYRLAKAICFKTPLFCFCHSAIPRPLLHASVVTMFSLLLLQCARHGWEVSSLLILLKSVFRSSVHSHFVPLFSNCLMLAVFSDRFGINFAKYWIAPRKDFNVLVFVGGFSLFTASFFSFIWSSSILGDGVSQPYCFF